MPLILKGLVSAVIIVVLSELARRHAVLSGLLAAMPLTTLLVILWVYFETKDVGRIQVFSWSVLLALLPTALFFVALAFALRKGASFWVALVLSLALWGVGACFHLWCFGR
jgi:uncharacterized membrane protein (GlpM family)